MRAPIFMLVLLVASSCQAPLGTDPAFPAAWAGHWRGSLQIERAGGRVQTVPMGLMIEELEGAWRWRLEYGAGGEQQLRDYRLRQQDGGWVIDEGGGLILPATRFGPVVVSRFSVGESLLLARYELRGEGLHFEILAGPRQGETLTEVDRNYVSVFALPTRQHAVLRR